MRRAGDPLSERRTALGPWRRANAPLGAWRTPSGVAAFPRVPPGACPAQRACHPIGRLRPRSRKGLSQSGASGMNRLMFYVYAMLVGLVGGVSSGLFGVGGGVIMVPAMMLLLKMDIKPAIGTSLAVIVPTAIMGTFKHYDLGHVQWRLAAALAPTAIAGGFVGSWLTRHIASADLKRIFGGFLVLVGIRLVFWK